MLKVKGKGGEEEREMKKKKKKNKHLHQKETKENYKNQNHYQSIDFLLLLSSFSPLFSSPLSLSQPPSPYQKKMKEMKKRKERR